MLTGIGFLYLIMVVLSVVLAYIWTLIEYIIAKFSPIGDEEKFVEEMIAKIPADITWENTVINTLDTYQLTSHKFSFDDAIHPEKYIWEWTCVVSLRYKTLEEQWYIKSYILLDNDEVFYAKVTYDDDENKLLISIAKSSKLSESDVKIFMVSFISLLKFLGRYVEENHESEMCMVNSAFESFPYEVLDTSRKQKFKYSF